MVIKHKVWGVFFKVSEVYRTGETTALVLQLKISPNTGKEPRSLITWTSGFLLSELGKGAYEATEARERMSGL